MSSKYTYYFVYRVNENSTECIDWGEPTGGMALPLHKEEHGLAMDIARQRYHTAPYEELILAEVWEEKDQFTAALLHRCWDQEMHMFLEAMA
jgi:hypothetical protein